MRVLAAVAALLLLAVSAAACGSVDPRGERAKAAPATEPSKPETSRRAERPRATRFRGAQAGAYRNAHRVCGVFTVRETARYYGVEARARAAAQAHATELYGTGPLRQAAFQGCLDGFRAKKS
jgi:Flp pilus assembly protein TadD